jgi:hypothetical protein
MKRIEIIVAFLLVGVAGAGVGWYLGYTRPAIRNMRLVREATGLDDAGIIKLYGEMQAMVRDHEDDDAHAAAISANALSALSTGDVSRANKWLILPTASYYVHHLANVPDSELPEPKQKLRRRIEDTMERNEELRSKIEESQRNSEPEN